MAFPGWHEAIIWPSAGILLIGYLGTNFGEISPKFFPIKENAFETVFCEIATILFQPRCIKNSLERINDIN